jgi:general nucleoside transport system ATP-binding protein
VAEIAAVGIVKRYRGLVANDGVSLSAERGEIHGVMGENGAGKTTLMSVLFGLQAPDAGEIRLRGAPVRFRSSTEAMAAGLGMVHQSFKLFGSLTAWENIVYGAEPRRGPFIDRKAASRSTLTPVSETCRSACANGSKFSRRSTATRASSFSTSRPRF